MPIRREPARHFPAPRAARSAPARVPAADPGTRPLAPGRMRQILGRLRSGYYETPEVRAKVVRLLIRELAG